MYHALEKLDSVSDSQTGKKSGFSYMFSSHHDTLKCTKHIKEMAEKDGLVLNIE